MRKLLFVLFLCLSLHPLGLMAERPKVAVVLCGGGAKGAAHIGALKVIEEAGVPVDMVVGTSMGAIVGGLYAIGYTPEQLDSIISSQNWETLLSDQTERLDRSFVKKENMEKYIISLPFSKKEKTRLGGGMVKGQNVLNLLTQLTIGYHDSIDFNTLPIPFACVAEDIYTGNEIVFHNGSLPLAIRSSMSIPGVFAPVVIGDHLLIDGGMCNNFPVDVARAMGADVVIGVDVQNQPKIKKEELESVFAIIGQVINLTGDERYRKNVGDTDIYIKVNVEGYSVASFTRAAIDTLIQRGVDAAESKKGELVRLHDELVAAGGVREVKNSNKELPQEILVKNIRFVGLDERDRKTLLKRTKMSENDTMSIAQINQAVSMMRSVFNYASVNYQLIQNEDGNDLQFSLQEKKEGSINVGLRFDSEEIAAVAMSVTRQFGQKCPTILSASGRLGMRVAAGADCSIYPFVFSGFNVSYKFMYNDVKLNDHGKRLSSFIYRCHLADANLTNLLFYFKMKLSLGIRYENYNFDNLVYNGDVSVPEKHSGYVNYYVHLFYDSFNKRSFPTKGTSFSAEYALITQAGLNFKELQPVSMIMADWKTCIPLTSRFVVKPAFSTRILLSKDDVPFPYKNAMGGYVQGRYVNQQLPFAGIGAFELVDDVLFIPSLTFRQRFWQRHYVSLIGNVAFQSHEVVDLFDKAPEYGVSLGYGFDSFFGPLEGYFYYSNRSDKFGFYVNIGLIF
ncbi:MAG: patatin-like phospholipase family protein [Paludibacteraceae bacterium]|nr:patatin-like phospholipase family protein [Paludibacteraceae bacterium]